MATAAPIPDQSQAAPPAGGADVKGILNEFRMLAMEVQQLATKYPEFQDYAAQILPLLMKGMTAVSGNNQRVPPAAAPPA